MCLPSHSVNQQVFLHLTLKFYYEQNKRAMKMCYNRFTFNVVRKAIKIKTTERTSILFLMISFSFLFVAYASIHFVSLYFGSTGCNLLFSAYMYVCMSWLTHFFRTEKSNIIMILFYEYVFVSINMSVVYEESHSKYIIKKS